MDEPFIPPKLSTTQAAQLEQRILDELRKTKNTRFATAQDHFWTAVKGILDERDKARLELKPADIESLRRAVFEKGIQSSWLVGVSPSAHIQAELKSWGWNQRDVDNFLGWAYRICLLKILIESGESEFSVLIQAAESHPLSEAEREAVEFARSHALDKLGPVYDTSGKLVDGGALTDERDRLRKLVVKALIKRERPLKLGREMYKLGKAAGIFRDYEELAITEMADCFHHGSFNADRISGKFGDHDFVFRIPRPQTCEICLSLYVEPNGTPRLYGVRELSDGKTKPIRIPGQTTLRRAAIGVPHSICSCSPWLKYHPDATPKLFERHRREYLEARRRHNLPISWRARLDLTIKGKI